MINGIKPNISNVTKTEKTMTKNGLSFDEAMDILLIKIQEIMTNGVEVEIIQHTPALIRRN